MDKKAKMRDLSPKNTIRYILLYFISSCLIGLLMHFLLKADIDYTIEFKIFVILFVVIHGAIGIGILLRKRWGLRLFRWYLLMLLIAFPIGTYLSIKMKKYIKKINLENYFY